MKLVIYQVAPSVASFNPYVNDMWALRCAVLNRFQQAARKVSVSVKISVTDVITFTVI